MTEIKDLKLFNPSAGVNYGRIIRHMSHILNPRTFDEFLTEMRYALVRRVITSPVGTTSLYSFLYDPSSGYFAGHPDIQAVIFLDGILHSERQNDPTAPELERIAREAKSSPFVFRRTDAPFLKEIYAL